MDSSDVQTNAPEDQIWVAGVKLFRTICEFDPALVRHISSEFAKFTAARERGEFYPISPLALATMKALDRHVQCGEGLTFNPLPASQLYAAWLARWN
jgi:hypothetical protein